MVRPQIPPDRGAVIQGFALIEAMVALVIVSVGLLGVAKMFAVVLSSGNVSGSRALAALYAGSLSSAMHANRAYWQAGLAPASVTVLGSSLSDATLNGQKADCAYSASNASPNCKPVEIASADLQDWGQSLLQLPSGQGAVSCASTSGAPVTCAIQVSWNEKVAGLNGSTLITTSASRTQTYTVLVQP